MDDWRIYFKTIDEYLRIVNADLCYQCDILIPSINLVIECDGIYWHASPEFTAILEKKAQIDIEQQIILKQKENVRLINDNIKLINMDDYFRYELINKWDGKSTIPVILDMSGRNESK